MMVSQVLGVELIQTCFPLRKCEVHDVGIRSFHLGGDKERPRDLTARATGQLLLMSYPDTHT